MPNSNEDQLSAIPTVDIASQSDRTIAQVEDACRDIGFMYIRGHGRSYIGDY